MPSTAQSRITCASRLSRVIVSLPFPKLPNHLGSMSRINESAIYDDSVSDKSCPLLLILFILVQCKQLFLLPQIPRAGSRVRA